MIPSTNHTHWGFLEHSKLTNRSALSMPVDGNCKHLGVTFSSDGKWTNHINDIIESSMKQINALRKPKYILS